MKKLLTLFALVFVSTAAFAAWPAQADIEKAIEQQVKDGYVDYSLSANAKVFVTLKYYNEPWPEGSQYRKPAQEAMCEGLIATSSGLVILGKECAAAVKNAYELTSIEFILNTKRINEFKKQEFLYSDRDINKNICRAVGEFAVYRMSQHLTVKNPFGGRSDIREVNYDLSDVLIAMPIYFQKLFNADEITLQDFENYFGSRPPAELKKIITTFTSKNDIKALTGESATK